MEMKIKTSILIFLTLFVLFGCSESKNNFTEFSNYNESEKMRYGPMNISKDPEPSITQPNFITETETPDFSPPTLLHINDLQPGQYLVTMSINEDKLNIWDTQGEKIGVFLNFSISGIIDPSYSFLAYESSVYTTSSVDLIGFDYAIYDIDSNNIIPIDMPNIEGGSGWGGSWSPNGEFIVINTLNEGNYPRLGLVTVGSLEFDDINLWDGGARAPDWSPDGIYIAFSSSRYPGNYLASSIFLLNTSCFTDIDTCREFVTKIFSDDVYDYYDPSWAPDSIHLVFSCYEIQEETMHLCIGDIVNGEVVVIENSESAYNEPAWSPDGEWIATTTNRDTSIIRPDGSDGRIIVENETFLFWISIPEDY